MRLRIWVTDDMISPDADPAIYTDIEMRFEDPYPKVQELALDLARIAVRKNSLELTEAHVNRET